MDFLSGDMQLMVQRLMQSSGMRASGAPFTYSTSLSLLTPTLWRISDVNVPLHLWSLDGNSLQLCEWTVSTQLSPASVQKIQFIWVSVDDQKQSITPLPSNIKQTFGWNTLCGRIWMRVETFCSFKTRKKELSSLRYEVKETRRNSELQNAWSCN